jgi:hypothetical protein
MQIILGIRGQLLGNSEKEKILPFEKKGRGLN